MLRLLGGVEVLRGVHYLNCCRKLARRAKLGVWTTSCGCSCWFLAVGCSLFTAFTHRSSTIFNLAFGGWGIPKTEGRNPPPNGVCVCVDCFGNPSDIIDVLRLLPTNMFDGPTHEDNSHVTLRDKTCAKNMHAVACVETENASEPQPRHMRAGVGKTNTVLLRQGHSDSLRVFFTAKTAATRKHMLEILQSLEYVLGHGVCNCLAVSSCIVFCVAPMERVHEIDSWNRQREKAAIQQNA